MIRLPAFCLAALFASLVVTGCSTSDSFRTRLQSRGETALAASDQYERGARLIEQGERDVERGRRAVRDGETRVERGRDRIDEGRALQRQARAAYCADAGVSDPECR